MADAGAPVVGICNGFQILCEAGMLPGAFIANRDLAFICRFVEVEVADTKSILTHGAELGAALRIPLNSYEGNYVDPARTGRVVLRYRNDPNGSQDQAAAVANQAATNIERARLTEELRQQARLRQNFERFMSPNVAQLMASYVAQHGQLWEPQELTVSVLFADAGDCAPMKAPNAITMARNEKTFMGAPALDDTSAFAPRLRRDPSALT